MFPDTEGCDGLLHRRSAADSRLSPAGTVAGASCAQRRRLCPHREPAGSGRGVGGVSATAAPRSHPRHPHRGRCLDVAFRRGRAGCLPGHERTPGDMRNRHRRCRADHLAGTHRRRSPPGRCRHTCCVEAHASGRRPLHPESNRRLRLRRHRHREPGVDGARHACRVALSRTQRHPAHRDARAAARSRLRRPAVGVPIECSPLLTSGR